MLPAENCQNIFWDVQVSIAKDIARLDNPSIAKLHHDVLEEFGQPPSCDLIDFFISIADIPKKEIDEYYNYRGISKNTTPEPEKAVRPQSKDPYLQLADTIVCGEAPTVLKFRQAFIKEHGESPSTKLIEYFLAKMQAVPQEKAENNGKQGRSDFAEKLAGSSNPTVLKFRQSFIKQFGSPPSSDLTQHFLRKVQEYASNSSNEATNDSFESQVAFTKMVAEGSVSTILDFRKEFKKSFGEEPPEKLIDIFLKNISGTKT